MFESCAFPCCHNFGSPDSKQETVNSKPLWRGLSLSFLCFLLFCFGGVCTSFFFCCSFHQPELPGYWYFGNELHVWWRELLPPSVFPPSHLNPPYRCYQWVRSLFGPKMPNTLGFSNILAAAPDAALCCKWTGSCIALFYFLFQRALDSMSHSHKNVFQHLNGISFG